MDHNALFIFCVLGMAYLFDFTNGVHDAANTIAAIVTTRVLTPRQAVLWAAFFNFIAFLFFNLMVAKTIGSGLITPGIVNAPLVFAALISAIFWNLLTWFFGLPSSSSHALIGGLAGAAVVSAGFGSLQSSGFVKVFIGICIAPGAGLLVGLTLTWVFTRLPQNVSGKQKNRLFKSLQLLSSAMLSLTHGGNDAQKTMGVIVGVLFSASWLDDPFYIPLWVVISCHATIALGTLMGGWRIVHTLGTKITKLDVLRGCAAESGAASIMFAATEYGVPVSTTQMLTGSIAGVGLFKGLKGVYWSMVRLIFISWLLTIPATALVAGFVMFIMQRLGY
jgi:PiT family inorganic phosphate transporter